MSVNPLQPGSPLYPDNKNIIDQNFTNLDNEASANTAKLAWIEDNATADQNADEVPYSWTLNAIEVEWWLNELDANKADASSISANLILYKTNAVADVWGYTRLVSAPSDSDYNTTAVDISTWAITWVWQLIWSQIWDADLFTWETWIISISTIWNIRRTAWSWTSNFYFEIYHRTSWGVETLIGTSSNSQAVESATYEQFNAIALIANTIFSATDRIVFKVYANRIVWGSNPTYDIQFWWTSPARSPFPVPVTATWWWGWSVTTLNTYTAVWTITDWIHWTFKSPQAWTIAEANAWYITAPTGSNATIEVFKNDVSIWTITVTDWATSWSQTTFSNTTLAKFDKIHYDITWWTTVKGWTITIWLILS